jgi:hypothetical protein
MHIRLTWGYLLAFVYLAAILGIGHELAHHVAGFLICGAWGYKTFNAFYLAKGCEQNHPNTFWVATLVGPLLLNYLPMWIGFLRMRRPDAGSKLFGLTLVFATIPIFRIVFSALHANDEPWVIRQLFGHSQLAFWLMNIAIWLVTLPPLILAWQTIQNRHRFLLFLFYLLALPVFVFVVVGLVLENMIVKQHILSDTLWGMPYLVLIVEGLAYLGYHLTKHHLWLRGARVEQTPEPTPA